MLALNMFEEAGRKEVAAPGQLLFAPMGGGTPGAHSAPLGVEEAARYLHRYQHSANACLLLLPSALQLPGMTSKLVSAVGSSRRAAPHSLKDHIPVLTSPVLLPRKAACLLFVPCS